MSPTCLSNERQPNNSMQTILEHVTNAVPFSYPILANRSSRANFNRNHHIDEGHVLTRHAACCLMIALPELRSAENMAGRESRDPNDAECPSSYMSEDKSSSAT